MTTSKTPKTPDPKAKRGQDVRAMFDTIAGRYDFMNRAMTLGMDQRWRRFTVDRAEAPHGGAVLDLASGTGDIAFELRRRDETATIVAGDFSVGMLKEGKRRKEGDQVGWIACDAMALPFADESFDAVTFGYLLRNVEDVGTALREIARVLKPGGRVVCLDTTPPKPSLMRPFITAYLKFGLPTMARLLAEDKNAYAYLGGSTLAFSTPDELKSLFEGNGFSSVHFKTFMFHTIAVHWAEKT